MPSFRHSTRIALVAAPLATLAGVAVPAAGAARAGFCKLLSARQLAAVHVTRACTQGKSIPFKHQGTTVATIVVVKWGHTGVVVADVYAVNPAYVSLAKAKFDVGGPSAGVGDWSRFKGFANGKTDARLLFGVGNYVVDLDVSMPPNRPLKSEQQIVKLATAIAGHLR